MEFKPSQAVRNTDVRKLEGNVYTFKAQHSDDAKTTTFFQPTDETRYLMREQMGFELHLNGWVQRYAEKDTTVELKIEDAWLVPHNNGGRDANKRAKTYAEFFNDQQRARYVGTLVGGLEARIFHSKGDADRCDILLNFEGGYTLDSMTWDIEAPGEWYSDTYNKNQAFLFQDGFFDTAEQAINHFSQQSKDDLFGTRYFPVLVFPLDTEQGKMDEVIWRPKSHSLPILTADHIIYGTRCKSSEYVDTIDETYKAGGKVARNREWDWQS